ncbi:hypothetical protein PMZ80_002266 [Knufia obscura]|uniref:Uncharacterized protein n=1 Tax=Knufia obscura TaxID=1635080 RepID=A0ABR0RXV4_9EURO|nr:hypothetical protein PMZ80_002266 [Knufia obscura]
MNCIEISTVDADVLERSKPNILIIAYAQGVQIDLAFRLKYATSSRVLVGVEDQARSIAGTIKSTGLIQAYMVTDSTTIADLTAVDSKYSQYAHEDPYRRFSPGDDQHRQVFQIWSVHTSQPAS